MARVLACIDGSIYSQSVAEHAAWAAGRLGAGVELLHVIGRREASSQDRSGRILPAARRKLLEDLAALDAERAKLLLKEGRHQLQEAQERVTAAGVTDATQTLRHGDVLEVLAEREMDSELTVLGKRGEAADFAAGHLGSNLERILRGASRPVLVAARAFQAPAHVMIAFDGRPPSLASVDAASRSALFAGLRVTLASVSPGATLRGEMERAAEQLAAGGLSVERAELDGDPKTAIPTAVEAQGVDLLVMGAYGHSRLRTLVLGSTTAEVIRSARVPILVYR